MVTGFCGDDRDACGATEKWCGSLSSRSRRGY